jgi:hypothetical protein
MKRTPTAYKPKAPLHIYEEAGQFGSQCGQMPACPLSHDHMMMTRWKQIDPGQGNNIAVELQKLARLILELASSF